MTTRTLTTAERSYIHRSPMPAWFVADALGITTADVSRVCAEEAAAHDAGACSRP